MSTKRQEITDLWVIVIVTPLIAWISGWLLLTLVDYLK